MRRRFRPGPTGAARFRSVQLLRSTLGEPILPIFVPIFGMFERVEGEMEVPTLLEPPERRSKLAIFDPPKVPAADDPLDDWVVFWIMSE